MDLRSLALVLVRWGLPLVSFAFALWTLRLLAVSLGLELGS